MKIKLLYKLLAINTLILVILIIGINLGIQHFAFQLIEQNRMMAYQNFMTFRKAINQYILYTSMIVIPLAIFLSWIFIRRIVNPLSEIKMLTQQIAKGDFQVKINLNQKDEIGELSESFNHMSEELQRIEQLRRNLVADVAHELRTPLSSIRGYMEAVNDGILPVSPELFLKSHHEVERLVQLVEDLHQLTLFENSLKNNNNQEYLNLALIAQEVIPNFQEEWNRKSIQLHLEIDENIPLVRLDRWRSIQIFNNLFDNTVRYTPAGESVFITLKEKQGKLLIEIKNTGIEIPKEALPLLFERFYRVDKSRSREYGGAGIGLAIVKDIVVQAGGRVWASSEGHSTTIHIEFYKE